MDSIVPAHRRLWLYAIGVAIMIFLIVPTILIIPMSFSGEQTLSFPPTTWSLRWYDAYFGSEDWRAASIVSLKLACLTTLLATPLATAAAYGLHVGDFPGARLIRSALASSLMVPVILFAIAAYFSFAQFGLVNTLLSLVLADTVLTTPYVIVTVTAGLKSYDMNQEMVARSLGASRLKAFLTVTLPQIRYSIVSAALFVFIGSFDEVVVATLLSSGANATLTNRMFATLQLQLDPTIAAVSTIMIVITMVPPIIIHMVGSRKETPDLAGS
jgi:putative spermidine/putrescine transport system permease protein